MFKTILVLFLTYATCLFGKTVYFVPIIGYDEQKLFYEPYSHRDQIAKPFCDLREAIEKMGYQVKFTHDCVGLDDVAAIISFEGDPTVTRNIKQYPRERCFLISFDPPVSTPWVYENDIPECYQKIFVMMDDLVDNVNYFKLYYPQPHFEQVKNIPAFSQKKLCVMITGNHPYHNAAHPNALYNERKKVVLFFEHLYRNLQIDDFDLYGRGWNYWLLWKGAIWDKLEVFKNYKFAICYENMNGQVGYITEKIFDCFLGGCVPVYLGADNITDYVPPTCFIDRRRFSSDQEMYDFIKNMDEKTYQSYMEAITDYLKSEQLKLFTVEHFVDMVMQELAKLPS
jgi:alpha(1,3/1,4) fucosyltransferase